MRIDHVQRAIPQVTEDTARVFWTSVIGMEELAKPDAVQGRGGLWLRSGLAELHLGAQSDFTPATKAHPCFAVDDLADPGSRLRTAGYPVRPDAMIKGRERFFTEDPFVNRVEFMQAD